MLERPGYTSTDYNQIRMTVELAHVAEDAMYPSEASDPAMVAHMERTLWMRFGTVRARWNERTEGINA